DGCRRRGRAPPTVLCAPLDARARDLAATAGGGQIVCGQLPRAPWGGNPKGPCGLGLDGSEGGATRQRQDRAPVKARLVHQPTVKTPFIPASAWPGTVQR